MNYSFQFLVTLVTVLYWSLIESIAYDTEISGDFHEKLPSQRKSDQDSDYQHTFRFHSTNNYLNQSFQILSSSLKGKIAENKIRLVQIQSQPSSLPVPPLLYETAIVEHIEPNLIDRSCLLEAPFQPEEKSTNLTLETSSVDDSNFASFFAKIVNFIERKAGLFLDDDGKPSSFQEKLDEVNLYKTRDAESERLNSLHVPSEAIDKKCRRINLANFSLAEFVNDFWLRQQPVIFENFTNIADENMDIVDRFSPLYEKEVGVKLSPSIDFEGVDNVSHWEMAATQKIPDLVLDQLQDPETVVVRAAHKQMKLKDVLSIINANHFNFNAYIEYFQTNNLPGIFDILFGDSSSEVIPKELANLFLGGKSYLWVSLLLLLKAQMESKCTFT